MSGAMTIEVQQLRTAVDLELGRLSDGEEI